VADAPAVPTTPPRRRVLPVAVALTVTAAAAATAALTIRAARRRSPAAAAHEEPPPPVPSRRQPDGTVWRTAGQEKPPADPTPGGTQRRHWPLPAALIIVALLAMLAAACAGMIQSETDSGSRYSDLRRVERPPHATFDMNDGSATEENFEVEP
jgi:hypothetical protein